MSDIFVIAFLFFIGSCLGWCMEVIFRRFFSKANPARKWINPGFLVGPYLPLYGFGLWGMYFVSGLSRLTITANKAADVAIVLVLMAVAMTVIEYIAGLIFIKGMNLKLWDYTKEKGNIQGIICPRFSVAWGMLGCIYYFVINPYVIEWVVWLSKHLTFSFFIGMFFGIFIIDLCYSAKLSANMQKFAKEKNIIIKYEELKEFMSRQREALREKNSFVFPFKSGSPLRVHLERYEKEIILKRNEKLKQLEETAKFIGYEVKNEISERKRNK